MVFEDTFSHGHRFAEAWVADDLTAGGELLDELAAFDGDERKVPGDVHARYVEADKRLIAYEDWCAGRGMEPVRWRGPYPFDGGYDAVVSDSVAPSWFAPGLRAE